MARKKKRVKQPKVPILLVKGNAPPHPGILEQFPDHARLIGYIIGQWSWIEHTLVWLLTFTMKQHGEIIHSMVYALLSSKSRLDALEPAIRKVLATQKPDAIVDEIFTEVRALLDKRNDYAHAFYTSGPHGHLVRMKLRLLGTEKPEAAQELTLDELDDTYARMKLLTHRVAGLTAVLVGLVPPPASPGPEVPPGALPVKSPGQMSPQPEAPPPPSPE